MTLTARLRNTSAPAGQSQPRCRIRLSRFTTFLLIVGTAIAGCSGPIGSDTITESTPSETIAPESSIISRIPPVLPKPKTLGAVSPAVICLPLRSAEPNIRIRLTAESAQPPYIPQANYRGAIQIVTLPNGKYIAVNVVPIETYLAGVLSRELYPHWSVTAYEAQAVAARTYAVYQMATEGRSRQWDVVGTTASQMYGGIRSESTRAWEAVNATRGQLLQTAVGGHVGIFCACYSACDGGAEQSPQEAWGDIPIACLPAQPTGYLDAACPKFNWPPMRISMAEVSRAMLDWGRRNSLPYLEDLGPITRVWISRYNGLTSRPTEITVADAAGKIGVLRAEEFRLAFLTCPYPSTPKPPSSFFRIQNNGDGIILYDGHGFGHGVGLSQWGAQALSLRGKSVQEILSFYYPGSFIHQEW